MSLKHKLEKVGSLKEAQLLFNNEVSRLKRLDVYKESESRLNGRIDKLKNDIDSYLIEHDIDGEVTINDDDYFLTKLFVGIFIWGVLFLGMVLYLNNNRSAKIVSEDNIKTTFVTTTEITTESNLVWNNYRQSYTSKDILKQDENWSSVNN
jgi:hypothetical protein